MAESIDDFGRSVQVDIGVLPGQSGIIQQIEARCERFQKVVRALAPDFKPFVKQEEEGNQLPHLTFSRGDNRVIHIDEVFYWMNEYAAL